MKKIYLLLTIGCIYFLSCQNDSNTKDEKLTNEEKTEISKVDSFKKTDKQKEDSVKEYWEKKMEKSKMGDE